MKRVWEEVSPGFKELGANNTMLIDDCLYKCMRNVSYSYIVPKRFDSEVEDNYILDTLWPYLVGLSEAPSILKYIGVNSHAQQHITTALECPKSFCMVYYIA
jgi:hypothetical protein